MRNHLVLIAVVVSSCTPEIPILSAADRALLASGPTDNPFVHAEGRFLVDGNNERITLNGYNLGGYLLWEGWMWNGGWSLDGEKKMFERLVNLIGEEDATAFRETVRRDFITEADIEAIADSGANVVRVPINHTVLENDDFTPREEGYQIITDLLTWCERHGVRAVLDMHSAPGGQADVFMADPDEVNLWESLDNQDRAVAIWQEIARRYANSDAVAAYDLLNEPGSMDKDTLLDMYQRIASAIREIDPNHLIIVEGEGAAGTLKTFDRAITWNQAYSVHQYQFFGDWRKDELARYSDVSEDHQVPVWVGEYGLVAPDNLAQWGAMFDDAQMAGRALWSWKLATTDKNAPMFIDAGDEWKKLAQYMNNGGGAPTADEARRAIEDFIAAMHVDNCVRIEETARALP